MATTENTNLPDKCPICGMEEDYRDTDNSRPVRVHFQCGIRYVLGTGAYPAGSWWWDGECVHAQEAALRCGATLHPTVVETARDALVTALIAEEDATLAYEAEITDLPTMTDAEDAALVAMNDAICARHKASTAYRIALAGAK